MKRILPLLSVMLLSACTTTGAPYSAAELPKIDKKSAQLVVYRVPAFFGDGAGMNLLLNGEETCKLGVNTFHAATVPAGNVEMEMRAIGMRQALKTVQLKPGERQYIRIGLNGKKTAVSLVPVIGLVAAAADSKSEKEEAQPYTLTPMPQEQAQKDLQQMRETLECK